MVNKFNVWLRERGQQERIKFPPKKGGRKNVPVKIETDLDKRTSRILLRVTKKQKKVIIEASVLAGFKSVGDYVINVAVKEADRVIRDNNTLILSSRDSILFLETLQNPPVRYFLNRELLIFTRYILIEIVILV